jgi:DNA-binding transcriptional MerR regulator
MSTTYRVKEFADLSGVTVRTLQYYDRIGLLKPSAYTKKNHRLYQIEDLLRLQQILTFKHVGYGLEDIRRLVNSPDYDVVEALKAQQKAIRDRIAQLQKVARSIDSTVDALASVDTGKLDWRLVRNVIAAILASSRWDWAHEYYTPAQKKLLAKRRRNVKPEQMADWQKQWAEVMLGFQRLMDRKRSAADAEVQNLAARADILIQGFTQGDLGIERSLGRAYANYEAVPKDRRPFPLELQRFISEACRIYRKNKR